jgi:protein-disulfide isomerase
VALFLALGGGGPLLVGGARQSAAPPAFSEATRDKVLHYIRERFGVADNIQLTLGPPRSSFAPGFYEASVIVDDGKNKHDQLVLISKDSHYLIVVLGNVVDLGEDSNSEMIRRLRETFKVPDTIKLALASFHPSPTADFREGALIVDNGKVKQTKPLLLTRDGKHLILSDLFNLKIDLEEKALHTISLRNQPSQGPENAPVTIVEYADLQCPMCAKLHEFLETEVLPRYRNKVRIVFKEFPLLGIHDWSLTAAIACQCAYQMNPSSYVPLRSAIFRNQQAINITNLRDLLLNWGEQAGLDRVRLAACIDAKSSLPRVNADSAEGKRVNVESTPTSFINGKKIVGLPSPEIYFQAVDEALRGAR